jgi:hypothetical protein
LTLFAVSRFAVPAINDRKRYFVREQFVTILRDALVALVLWVSHFHFGVPPCGRLLQKFYPLMVQTKPTALVLLTSLARANLAAVSVASKWNVLFVASTVVIAPFGADW